jgi:beta-glucanase (GH16 family)
MPLGVGLWPSINLLPEDSPEFCLGCGYYGDWPQSGAITLSQRLNKDKDYTGGILYGGVAPSVAASTFSQKIASEPTGYHTYTLEWSSSKMKWKLDGKTVYTA